MISIRQIISTIANHVQRLLTQPTEELSRAQRSVRYMYELTSHCVTELGRDQALQMAAALTYRTIFSLIPLFVLALVVFRLTGGLDDKRQQVQQELYNYLGLDFSTTVAPPVASDGNETSLTTRPSDPAFTLDRSMDDIASQTQPDVVLSKPADQASNNLDATAAAAATQPAIVKKGLTADVLQNASDSQKLETRESLDTIIQSLTDKISNTSASGITIVGLIVLIWAAVSLVVTVEQSLNQVYGTPTGRPWHLKILLYWGVITLGPVLLAVSLYMAGFIMAWAQTLGPVGWLAQQLSRFTALAASWLLLFLLYVLMPNTRVNLKPAAIGAFVAACLWEVGKWGFKLYAANAGFTTLYGSLALIPLFLYWVYITWTIVLFGAELSYTLQAMRGRNFKHDPSRDRQSFIDPRWILPMMVAIGQDFDQGKESSPDSLAQRLGLPHRAMVILSQKLHEKGLINEVQCNDESTSTYALSRTPDTLLVSELLNVSDSLVANAAVHHDTGKAEWSYVHQLNAYRLEQAGDKTLMDLIRQKNDDATQPVTA